MVIRFPFGGALIVRVVVAVIMNANQSRVVIAPTRTPVVLKSPRSTRPGPCAGAGREVKDSVASLPSVLLARLRRPDLIIGLAARVNAQVAPRLQGNRHQASVILRASGRVGRAPASSFRVSGKCGASVESGFQHGRWEARQGFGLCGGHSGGSAAIRRHNCFSERKSVGVVGPESGPWLVIAFVRLAMG